MPEAKRLPKGYIKLRMWDMAAPNWDKNPTEECIAPAKLILCITRHSVILNEQQMMSDSRILPISKKVTDIMFAGNIGKIAVADDPSDVADMVAQALAEEPSPAAQAVSALVK